MNEKPRDETSDAPAPEHEARAAAARRTPTGIVVGRPLKTPPPRWVLPTIMLTLVAGIAIGLVIGWSFGGDASTAPGVSTTEPATPTTGGATSSVSPGAFGTVEVTGDPLPVQGTVNEDDVIGSAVPEVTGHDFSGNEVAITNDGRAKIILMVAHWCPYCQGEVPMVHDWYAAADLPDNVDVYSVIIWTDPTKDNFPPSAWLESESWDIPVIVDDEQQTVADAMGVGAVPFWVLVNPDGTLYDRGSGQLSADSLDQIALTLSQGPQ